ncbi:DMT family transporter [Ornithinimicrobium panacihumi]|uniref:DMT family transporter n=1 Tax=Ornithinimicrobium panacihumi TaxID=2008449 RepID=UPI003F8B96EF
MGWGILLVSAVLEAVWATALGASEGFTRLGPSIVFGIFCVLSLLGLAQAMKHIPIGTAYAVWTGLGAVLTVAWAAFTGVEPLTPLKVLFLLGIIGCAAGLKLASAGPAVEATEETGASDVIPRS